MRRCARWRSKIRRAIRTTCSVPCCRARHRAAHGRPETEQVSGLYAYLYNVPGMSKLNDLPIVQGLNRAVPRLKGLATKPWFYPLALLLIGLLAYAYQLGALGFYWDDWEVVFLLHTKDAALLYGYFAFDRPFAWPYQLLYA